MLNIKNLKIVSMSTSDYIKRLYKSYIAKWTAILFIIGSIGTVATWVSGGKDWVNRKIDKYIDIQKEGVINNADSLIKKAILEQTEYYDGLINSHVLIEEEVGRELQEHHNRVKLLTDAMLGELDRQDLGNFNIWTSDSGKHYYERSGNIYSAWFESNRQRWVYRDYLGIVYKCN